jgi:hypothetical protein
MPPTGVVGDIAVGVDGRVVRFAKARVPFLARLTGQGVEPGDGIPVIVSCTVTVPVPQLFVAVSVHVNVPGLVGVPEISPVFGFTTKPWGSMSGPKLVGLWFVLGVYENGIPVLPGGGF